LGGSLQNIEIGKYDMALQISSFLQHGWENLWKSKILWLFSSLILIEPLFRLIVPIQKSADLLVSFFDLVVSFVSIYFSFMSIAGVSFVSYCIAIGRSVDFRTAFQASQNLFWRIVALGFLVLVFILPFGCIFAFSSWEFLYIRDMSHNVFIASIPLFIFAAMMYFPITETITNESKIGKSLTTAWAVFTHNFVNLAIIGLLLVIGLRVINISISMATMLVQNNFDVSALAKLDFISPQLSFANNNFYKLMTAITQTIWQTYSISIFTFAYLKYTGAKINKHITS
jgi:hypothetical protein